MFYAEGSLMALGRQMAPLPLLDTTESSPGSEVIKLFSCSTQLSMKFSLRINMPTIVGIFIFISREIFKLSYV